MSRLLSLFCASRALAVASFTLLAIVFMPSLAQSQACPAGRFCYYVPPAMKPSHDDTTKSWNLVLSSSFGTISGTYRVGNGAPIAFTVSPGSPLSVSLDEDQGVIEEYESVERRGVYVEASSDALGVTHRRSTGNEQASSTIKDHTRALGRRFRMGSYSLNGQGASAPYDIVSIYSPTGAIVTLEAPPGAPNNFWEGTSSDTITLSLAAGQTYMQRTRKPGVATCARELDGALITSDRPISVSTGGRGWAGLSGLPSSCGGNGGCGDDGQDHILPVDQIGTSYVVATYSSNGAQRVSVVADEDMTQVSVDGAIVATLAAGESHHFVPSTTNYIETSRPAYVYHNTGLGTSCELGFAFVPPLAFGSTANNFASFDVIGGADARIVIEASQASTLNLDGAPLVPSATHNVPGRSDLRVLEVNNLTAGNHILDAVGDFQFGVVSDSGPSGLYSYYNVLNLVSCGDGNIDANEGCDDGGQVDGDGCNAQCKIELDQSGCSGDSDCVAGGRCDSNNVCVACLTDSDCNDANACTDDTCLPSNRCQNTPLGAATPCPGGVCNGDPTTPLCVQCIDDSVAGPDSGCSQTSLINCNDNNPLLPVCVGCIQDNQCDDGNPCTDDECNGGACEFTAENRGDSCGMSNVCNGDPSAPECVTCISDSNMSPARGCDATTPYCDTSGSVTTCSECLVGAHCANGELCDAGFCQAASVDISTPLDGSTTNTLDHIDGFATSEVDVTITLRDSNNNTVDAQVVTAFGGTWNFTPGALADDTYTITASVDAAGGSVTDTHTVTLDTTPPPITIVSPADNSTVTNPFTTISGTSEANMLLNTITIIVRDDMGAQVDTQSANASASGMWSFTTFLPADGDYTIEATARDQVGNTGSDNPITITLDATPPAITIDSPSDGSTINTNTTAITGTSEPGADVEVFVDGASIGAATIDAAGGWSITSPPLADGTHTATATASDSVGNSDSAGPIGFTVDTTAPPIAITSPADNAILSDTTPTISGTSEDGAALTVLIKDSSGATVQTTSPTPQADGSWSFDAMMLPGGDYTIEASATDAVGNNASAAPISFTIDDTLPLVTITNPVDMSHIATSDLQIEGEGDPGATIEVFVDGSKAGEATADAMGNWTFGVTMLADGAHTTTATSTDLAGNSASAGPVTFTVDTVAPALSIDAPADNSTTNDDTPTIGGTSEDGAALTVLIKDSSGATVETATPTPQADGSWSFDAMSLQDGTYTVEANATDQAGNASKAGPVTFTVDTVAPVISIATPADGERVEGDAATISGETEPAASVEVFIDGASIGQVMADASGEWSIEATSLAEGERTATATATDANGNSGTSDPVTFTSARPPEITTPEDGSEVAAGAITIEGSGTPGDEVEVTLGDKSEVITVGEDGSWSVTFEDNEAGEVVASAQVDEGATDSITITFIDAQTPAEVAILSPAEGDMLDGAQIEVSGTGTASATVRVLLDGQTEEVVVGEDGTWAVTFEQVSPGAQTITATIDDASASVDITVTEELIEVDPEITTPEDGAVVEGPTITVGGRGNPGDDLTVRLGELTKTATVGEDGTFSATFTEAEEGEVAVTVSDDEGRSDAITITVTAPFDPSVTYDYRGGGGACSSAPGEPPTLPVAWLLLGVGVLFSRRRR